MKATKIVKRLFFILGMSIICFIAYKAYNIITSDEHEFVQTNGDRKILIISMHATGGHKTVSNALSTILKEQGYSIDTYYIDTPTHPYTIFIEAVLNNKLLAKYFHPFVLWFGSKIGFKGEIIPHKRNLNNILRSNQYGCIISAVPSIPTIADELETNVPIIQIDVDTYIFDCNLASNKIYNVTFWDTSVYRLIEAGQDVDRIFKIKSVFCSPKFYKDVKTKNELRKELGLPLDKDVVLVLFGSCGSEYMIDIMNQVASKSNKFFVFVCGKSAILYDKLTQLNKECGSKHLILPFINNMHEYMQASDLMIGKLGFATAMELLVCGLPIILPKFVILNNEKYNVCRLINERMAFTVSDFSQITDDFMNHAKEKTKEHAKKHHHKMDEFLQIVNKLFVKSETV